MSSQRGIPKITVQSRETELSREAPSKQVVLMNRCGRYTSRPMWFPTPFNIHTTYRSVYGMPASIRNAHRRCWHLEKPDIESLHQMQRYDPSGKVCKRQAGRQAAFRSVRFSHAAVRSMVLAVRVDVLDRPLCLCDQFCPKAISRYKERWCRESTPLPF